MEERFKNIQIRGIHSSRWIMSWIKGGGKLNWYGGVSDFDNWLESLGLTEEEIDVIRDMAKNGKAELESSTRVYLKKISKNREED